VESVMWGMDRDVRASRSVAVDSGIVCVSTRILG